MNSDKKEEKESLGKSKSNNVETEARVKVSTILGDGAVFDGDLKAPEAIRIDGTINGNCTCEKEVVIGKNGHLKGNISAQNVVISGRVEGDINAMGKLELLSTGKLVGNISARSLVIDEDAFFDGRCTMTATQDSAKKSTGTQSQTETAGSSETQKK